MLFNLLPLRKKLLEPTSFFGLKLWILVLIIASLIILLIVALLLCCIHYCRRRKSRKESLLPTTIASNDQQNVYGMSSYHRRLLSNGSDIEMKLGKREWSKRFSNVDHNSVGINDEEPSVYPAPARDRWRQRLSKTEIEVATNEFARKNLIGNGDFGSVFHAILLDATRVAVKKLVVSSVQADEFITEVEAMGHIRHRNLVKLLGYSIEGAQRTLVYEYIDNKNLQYWLHECPKQLSPLSWSIRMHIMRGIAKGLLYLHEGLDQRVLHRDIKSSNIMLDHVWNPLLSDFGVAKLFKPQWGMIVMETLGYMGPANDDYDGDFTGGDDIYSFGILLMEIITGRKPVDNTQNPHIYLVDSLKSMIGNRKAIDVVDPNMPGIAPPRELKRVLLIALRCVDPVVIHRPTMGEVIHMLQPQPRDIVQKLTDKEELFFSSTTSSDSD
ncbi:hypothetical protein UlMin_024475 [Ulmus minor]